MMSGESYSTLSVGPRLGAAFSVKSGAPLSVGLLNPIPLISEGLGLE